MPWGAIAAELSEDYDERTVIIAYRMLIGLVGGGFLYSLSGDVFPASENFENGLLNPDNYPLFALMVSALMFVWMTFSTFATIDQIKYLPSPPAKYQR